MRRVADCELHPFDRAELEALEHLLAWTRHVTTEMAVGAETRRGCDAYIRIGAARVPLTRHDLRAGDLDDFAALRLKMDARTAGEDAAEIEHHGNIVSRCGLDDAIGAFETKQLRRRAHRAFMQRCESLGVEALFELEVGIGLLGLD